MGHLSDGVKSLKLSLSKSDLAVWRDELLKGPIADCWEHLETIDTDRIRKACDEATLQRIERYLLPLAQVAASASINEPPEAQHLLEDRRVFDVANGALKMDQQRVEIERADTVLHLVKALEQAVREEIRTRSAAVIAEISEDIKGMWAILHPGESIDDVHIYLPRDADKAIDIGLKFHGKELDSPRLTLSEGYRNSLGLCIFLAMAKREAVKDRPVILDDVVISLDRNHRGMIVELLQKEFPSCQVLIFTHDRDWYTELRQRLDLGSWAFKALLPYENPQTGIRWSPPDNNIRRRTSSDSETT